MKQRGFLQSNRAIGFTLFINKKRKSNSRLLPESARIIRVAQPDGCEAGAFVFEPLFVLAQLRDVLTAENSTPVAQEHQHRWPLGPERPKLDFFPINIGQNHTRQPATVGVVHGNTF